MVGLTLTWAGLQGDAHWQTLVFGAAVALLLVWLVEVHFATHIQFPRVLRLPGFIIFFIRELLYANLRMAWLVLNPRARVRPGVVAIPLAARTETEITLLANVITLTPGTLSLDVSTDRSTLYIHAIEAGDPAAVRRDTKHGFERRVLELLR
jgi:multicomponent Na+:H+ antiporter subunit E